MQIKDINDNLREVVSVTPDPSFPGFLKVDYGRRTDWYSVSEFLEKNPDLEHLLSKTPKLPSETTGVVSNSTPNSLTDSSARWLDNSYLGFTVWISRGTGEGQKRTIIKNDHNTATIDKEWEHKPNKTSQYVFSHNLKDLPAMGNTLPQADIAKLEQISRKIDLKRGIIKPKEFYHQSAKKKHKNT